ncbi:MAG: hypothetical protein ACYDEI_01270 [Erysipelotrichaceae bacterium]
MKTLLKLITLSAAAVVAYKVYESNKKRKEKKDASEIVTIDTLSQGLPELLVESKLDDSLIQSYKVQSKVMMDSYPSNQIIDIIHTVTFTDTDNLKKFTKYLKQSKVNHDINMDNLSINLKSTIQTDVQEAFNSIIKFAEMSLDYHGIYQGWVFENLK